MAYYWGFNTIDDAICAIREHDRMTKLKSEKRKNKIYYLTDNYEVKE